MKLIAGSGLSAGNVTLYSGSDTSDDILGGLGGTISTTPGNVKTDVPVTASGKLPREIQHEVLTPAAASIGNGGAFTLKILLRW